MNPPVLIGAPVDSGQRQPGCLMGPAAYRVAGLSATLAALGHPARDRGDLALPATLPACAASNPALDQLPATLAWTAIIRAAVAEELAAGHLPILLGGDHALALGSVAGAADYAAQAGRPLFLLWLDAHSDFHTPQSTVSGNLHGTPVAYAAGRAGFDPFPPFPAPVPPERICLFGIRSVDPAERVALAEADVAVTDMRTLDEHGIAAPLRAFLTRVAQAGGMLHVSLDVDFLDPGIAPAVGTTVPGGATFREAHLVCEMIHESGLMTSLDLVELNPFLDERGRTARLMVDLVGSLMGRTVFDRPTPFSPEGGFSMSQPSHNALVPFVSVENMMRLVLHVGIEPMMVELADAIEADFRRWPAFDKTPRVASHSDIGVIELMPTSDGQQYGFKYVNGHPGNMRQGLQTVTAFGVLADVPTGYPLLISEMTLLTALRTAATSAMAAKWLAPRDARAMAMIGNGAQAEFQALAMKAVCGITEVRLYDIDSAATRKCAANLAGRGLRVVSCATAEDAILSAQILTTCTADKQYATILTDNMVGGGVHINAVGGDCPGKTELHRDILLRAGIFTEYTPQTRIEGEIQQLAADHPVTELWQVISGAAEGRSSAGQVTLFDSVGFAIEDFSALRYIHARLQGTGFHQDLDMIADPDDPRDLFGMLCRADGAGCAA